MHLEAQCKPRRATLVLGTSAWTHRSGPAEFGLPALAARTVTLVRVTRSGTPEQVMVAGLGLCCCSSMCCQGKFASDSLAVGITMESNVR